MWIAAEGAHLRPFLEAYGAHDLDVAHIEYALPARALRDLWARVDAEVDRPGVEQWGFDRVARLDDDLEAFAAFAA